MRLLKPNKNNIFSYIIRLAITLLIIAGIIVLIPSHKKSSQAEEVSEALAYIQQEESKDISNIDAEKHRELIQTEMADMDIWQKLNSLDTYIMGDSRCVGFAMYTNFDLEHLFAEGSTTLKYVDDCLPAIEAAKPAHLILSFGMNDMGMYTFDPDNYWANGEEYAEALIMYTDKIKEVSPDTYVYWNSIIPAMPEGIENQPMWMYVDEWNAAMEEAAAQYDKADFINVSDLFYSHPEAYGEDGVHFSGIYDQWAEAMFDAISNNL